MNGSLSKLVVAISALGLAVLGETPVASAQAEAPAPPDDAAVVGAQAEVPAPPAEATVLEAEVEESAPPGESRGGIERRLARLESLAVAIREEQQDEDLRTGRYLTFGLASGFRFFPRPGLSSAAIDVRTETVDDIDQTVRNFRIDRASHADFSAAIVALVYPWPYRARSENGQRMKLKPQFQLLSRLGLAVSMSLFSFSSDDQKSFVDGIEGGFGLAIRVTDDVHLTPMVDYRRVRIARSGVEDRAIVEYRDGAGEYPSEISLNDDRFFRTVGRFAFALRFVYAFSEVRVPAPSNTTEAASTPRNDGTPASTPGDDGTR